MPARVITALVTPFDDRGGVDCARAAELAARLVARGSDGIMLAGTTGESPTLSLQEKLALCQAVRRRIDGQAELWLGTGSYDTLESVRQTRAAADAGAQGVMAVVPYYSRPPQEGLRAHFVALAAATSLPVMIYNIPGRTGTNLSPRTLAAIQHEAANVVAVKEASRDLEQVAEVRRLLPPDFAIYSGDDALTLPVLAVGGAGVVSVASHLVPDRIAALVAAFLRGDVAEARRRHLELLPLYRALFVTTNPIPVKYALRLAGFACGGFRPPLCEPTPEEAATVAAAVDALGLRDALA
jgi:4-hydroxy-tetrahydrodipicolinate synthase